MRLSQGRFLADQNLDEVVVAHLRADGLDIVTSAELGLSVAPDSVVLASAVEQRRIVLTHDTGFGEMVVRQGHAQPEVVLALLTEVLRTDVDEVNPWLVSAYAGPRGPVVRVRSMA